MNDEKPEETKLIEREEVKEMQFLDQKYNKNYDSNNILLIKNTEIEEVMKKKIKKFCKRDNFMINLINANNSLLNDNDYLINDVSKVNINKYCHNENQFLSPISDIFSDNINVFIPMTLSDLEIIKNKLSWKKDFNHKCRAIINGIFEKYNLYVKNKISGIAVIIFECNDNLKKIYKYKDVKNKDTEEDEYEKPKFNKSEETNTKNNIENILKNNEEIRIKIDDYKKSLVGVDEGNLLFINMKIGLEDIKLKEFLEIYQFMKKDLFNNNIFLLEQDITTDLIGTLDYSLVKNHLIKNMNFYFEGDNEINKIYPYNNDEIGWIKDNETSHGQHVITFLIMINGIKMRIKIYNKYLCNIICPGVRRSIGTHFIDTINQKSDKLKDIFTNDEYRKNGVSRIECTLYYNNMITDYNFYDDLIKKAFNYFNAPIYYYTSFKNQFKALIESIKCNLLILDRKTSKFYLSYYTHNLNNRKIIGIMKEFKNADESHLYKIKNFILSAYSYPKKPIFYIEMIETELGYKLYKSAYCKLIDNSIILNQSNFHSTGEKNYEINLSDYGFEYDEFQLEVLKKKYHKNSEPLFEMTELKDISINFKFVSDKKREEILENELYSEITQNQLKILQNFNNKYHEEIQKKLRLLIQEKEKRKLNDLIQKKFTDLLFHNLEYKSLLDLEINTYLNVCGFIEIQNENNTLLLFDDHYNKYFIDNYNRKAFEKNKYKLFKINYFNARKNKDYCIYTYDIFNETLNYRYIYQVLKELENYSSINRNKYNIYTFQKEKNNMNMDFSGLNIEIENSKRKIHEIDKAIKEITQYDNQFNEISYKKCIDMSILYDGEPEKKIKKKDLKNMKIKFNENVFTLLRIKEYLFKDKKKYIFMVANDKNYFRSNNFFDDEINKICDELKITNTIDLNNKINTGLLSINFSIGGLISDKNKNYSNAILMKYN